MSQHSMLIANAAAAEMLPVEPRYDTLLRARSFETQTLAESITRSASKQTWYTIRLLVDRPLVADAYRAYAYFRWVDDYLDKNRLERSQRIAFVERQRALVERAYRINGLGNLTAEEQLVTTLVRNSGDHCAGLRAYIDNMMAVMAFDADRRGRLISQAELTDYTRWLATAVTEALHHFIGHQCASPQDETRYLAVSAAHITHMLRDAREDAAAGYFNIPRQFLESHQITPFDNASDAYRAWVRSQVQLARDHFQSGRAYLARVESLRCRIAGHAYIARFERVLDTIERDGFRLRVDYPESKNARTGLKIVWQTLSQAILTPPIFAPVRAARSVQ